MVLCLPGCSRPHPSGSVAVQLSTRSPTVGPDGPAGGGDSAVVALGNDTIIVRRAHIVATEVALQLASTQECEPGEDEGCAMLEAGPLLLDFPLDAGAEQILRAPAPANEYSVFQLQIHRADTNTDATFIVSHPEFANTSVRIDGTFSRSGVRRDFVFVSRFNEIQELELAPPLRVQPDETLRLTLTLDLARLFLSADKATLVDPASANPGGPHESLMNDNMRLAVTAFRDEDRDGRDDGHEGSIPEASGGS